MGSLEDKSRIYNRRPLHSSRFVLWGSDGPESPGVLPVPRRTYLSRGGCAGPGEPEPARRSPTWEGYQSKPCKGAAIGEQWKGRWRGVAPVPSSGTTTPPLNHNLKIINPPPNPCISPHENDPGLKAGFIRAGAFEPCWQPST